jgi:lipid-binding SYLF domain-containing protein
MNMENQMESAARHLRNQMSDIPGQFLTHAKGLVFLTMVKGAFLWSGSLSTGIVVKKLGPQQWSPPISVGMASFGFGLQAGGEKVDIIIIIGDDEEIATFQGTGQLKLGVSVSKRSRESRLNLQLTVICFKYGMAAGVSLTVYLLYVLNH